MTVIDYAIEFAHQMHEAGYCWDEAVTMAENEFGLDCHTASVVYETYDA